MEKLNVNKQGTEHLDLCDDSKHTEHILYVELEDLVRALARVLAKEHFQHNSSYSTVSANDDRWLP